MTPSERHDRFIMRLRLSCPDGADFIDSFVYRSAVGLLKRQDAATRLLFRLVELKTYETRKRIRWERKHERKRIRVAALAEKMAKYVTEFPAEFAPRAGYPDLARLLRYGARRVRRGSVANAKHKPPTPQSMAIRRIGTVIPEDIEERYLLISRLLGLVGIDCTREYARSTLKPTAKRVRPKKSEQPRLVAAPAAWKSPAA